MQTQLQKKNIRYRALLCILILWLSLVTLMGSDADFQQISERLSSSMIAAGYMDIDLSGSPFGLNIFSVDGMDYDGVGDIDDPTSARALIYSSQQLSAEDASVLMIRNQQLGTQGWMMYHAAKICSALRIPPQICYLGCRGFVTLLFILVITAIAFQLKKAYNSLFALTFFLVSIFSPVLRDFVPNLYWLPFSWFLPMLLGLIALNRPEKRGWIYPLMVLAIAFKSSFGYEYISNVMLGAILFLFVEWLCALRKDPGRAKLLFRTIFGIGISCLLGFLLVLLLNAYWRGGGNLAAGLDDIYRADVLRRTYGNPEDFGTDYIGALTSSVFSVLAKYIFASSLCLLSSGLLVINLILLFRRKKQINVTHDLLLLLVSYVFCLSWVVLAKGHAYIHRFSQVMLLLPYLQTAVYLLCKHLSACFPDCVRKLFPAAFPEDGQNLKE